MKLDVMELCTPELQKKLAPMRDKIKEMDDKKAASLKVSTVEGHWSVIDVSTTQVAKQLAKAQKDVKYEPYDFPDGMNGRGLFDHVISHTPR